MDNQGEGADSSWFDITRIKQLVRLMRDNDLSEIDMQQENSRLRLRRGRPKSSRRLLRLG